jgi:nucleoside-diphosphate-sugar epimerase
MTSQTVISEGIFHGQPTFPEHDGRSYTAIVTGANGVSGTHILQQLAASPKRWKKVYALSRKPPGMKHDDHVTFISLDFLKEPQEIAKVLKENDVKA